MSDSLLKDCADFQRNSYGTFKIFQRRADIYRLRRHILNFLGLIVPLFVGALALSFTGLLDGLRWVLIPAAGFVTIVQLSVSLWSLISGWDSKYDYAIGSVKNNLRLESEFTRLLSASDAQVKRELPKLRDEYSKQNAEDTAHGVSGGEIRYGYRSALVQNNLQCPVCKKHPFSMSPLNCDACGNFPKRYKS